MIQAVQELKSLGFRAERFSQDTSMDELLYRRGWCPGGGQRRAVDPEHHFALLFYDQADPFRGADSVLRGGRRYGMPQDADAEFLVDDCVSSSRLHGALSDD